MKTPKTPDTRNPAVNQAAGKGQVNTQALEDNAQLDNDNFADQSQGAKAEGQATAMHGQGAGFSRSQH